MCSKLKIKNLLFKSESIDNHASVPSMLLISEIQLKNQWNMECWTNQWKCAD